MNEQNGAFQPVESGETVVLPKAVYDEIKGQLMFLDEQLTRLRAQPLVHATVVQANNQFDLSVFEPGDRMLIIDKKLRKEEKFWGKIVSNGVDEDGWVILEYPNRMKERLNIGLDGNLPQVKLLGKDDGTNVTITFDGKLFEVHGLPGVKFNPAENVKVDLETKQIHAGAGVSSAGDVAYVKGIVDGNHIEVESNGTSRVVIYNLGAEIKSGDRVMLDNSSTVIIRVLERDGKDRFNLRAEANTTWDEIAGLEDAKDQLIEALELPYQHPETYRFYNMKPPKGVLLFGPQGCGKTLCAKAAAASLARIHGSENFQSGFIYVKGPELLSKWVGQTEYEIRGLFTRGREHFEKHNYPALLFIDEADAILPMRGTGKSSDVENTIVPQFLSEMDGLEESGVMVLLATNQPKRLDPAVVREGRVDRHIKINRPNERNTVDYFRIHLRGTPIAKGLEFEEVAHVAAGEIFRKNRVLYRVSHQKTVEIFTLGDAITGAMVAGIVSLAKSYAMKRDLRTNNREGVTLDDFVRSVQDHYVRHADLNGTFDLEDFCDRHGFDRKATNIEKLSLAL
jgi:proteasome-associated ATPase